MLGREAKLFTLFGFEVKIDTSWIVIALLVTWTLSAGYFPANIPDLSPAVYWTMGVVGAVGLFASIIFHEFWHSLVARRYGLPMKGITLFLFGGVSQMEDEPQEPKTEFLMAVAGPASSVVLGFLFFFIYRLGTGAESALGQAVTGILGYLAFINWILAGFNLLPAFPLDGGRILRSALWGWKSDLRWATETAAHFGTGFGFVLIALGVLSLLTGNLVGGIWYVIIGLFLRNAAQMSYRQVLMRGELQGRKVRELMRTDPVTAPADITVEELVENYIYRHHYKMMPVVSEGRLVGCITTRQVKEIPREEWSSRRVRELSGTCSPENTIAAGVEVSQALAQMNSSGNSRLIVVDEDRLVGVITLKDLMGFISTRLELGE